MCKMAYQDILNPIFHPKWLPKQIKLAPNAISRVANTQCIAEAAEPITQVPGNA